MVAAWFSSFFARSERLERNSAPGCDNDRRFDRHSDVDGHLNGQSLPAMTQRVAFGRGERTDCVDERDCESGSCTPTPSEPSSIPSSTDLSVLVISARAAAKIASAAC
jgi:hypothetical protein